MPFYISYKIPVKNKDIKLVSKKIIVINRNCIIISGIAKVIVL